jgi:hypothetical protein
VNVGGERGRLLQSGGGEQGEVVGIQLEQVANGELNVGWKGAGRWVLTGDLRD